MANTLTDLMATLILPEALNVLRENCIMPALVFTDYQPEAAQHNQTIRVQGPQDLGDADDMAAAIAASGTVPTALGDPYVDIVMDQWKYKQFEATDKEMWDAALKGTLASAAASAVKGLANAVDKSLLGLYKDIPYFTGTAGSTPADTDAIFDVREIMEQNLVPKGNRNIVVNSALEKNLLIALQDASKTGSTEALRQASIGPLAGFDIYADQLIAIHAAGNFDDGSCAVNGDVAAGATTMNLTGGADTGTVKIGDVFTVDGAPGQYVFTAAKSATGGAITGATFAPAAPAGGFASGAVVTITATHVPNLAFHRSAFALVMRPLTDPGVIQTENSTVAVQVDPISGISLRLESWRKPEFASRQWRFDILYGVKTIRPELAARLLG